MADSPFHSQIEQNIQTLLAEKNFKEAYRLCTELIEKFPDESSYNQLLIRIEKEVQKENSRKIKEKIKALDPLWKQEKYSEIIRELLQVLNIYPDHLEAKSLYEKAQNLYSQQIGKLQKQFEKQQRIHLSELLKNNPGMLVQDLFELEKNNPGNLQVKNLAHEYRTALIKEKINSQRELLSSNKYEAIENFIHQLRKIEEENPEITKIEKSIESKKARNQFENEREYLYENQQHIEVLIKLKKYDKAATAIEELLDKFPKNEELKTLLRLAKRKLFSQTKKLSIKSIEQNKEQLKNSYEAGKQEFIKILGF